MSTKNIEIINLKNRIEQLKEINSEISRTNQQLGEALEMLAEKYNERANYNITAADLIYQLMLVLQKHHPADFKRLIGQELSQDIICFVTDSGAHLGRFHELNRMCEGCPHESCLYT